MKAGCAVVAGLAIVAFMLAVGGLIVLGRLESGGALPPPSRPPQASLVPFRALSAGPEYQLTYGFRDFHGTSVPRDAPACPTFRWPGRA